MKKRFFILLIIMILFSSGLALATKLEVDYPTIPEVEKPNEKTLDVDYYRYIFYGAIALGGIIGFVVIVYGGILYLASTGNPELIKKGKEYIYSSITGLTILLCSYLILITLNPNLIDFQSVAVPSVASTLGSGTYLCKEDQAGEMFSSWTDYETYLEQLDAFHRSKNSKEKIEIADEMQGTVANLNKTLININKNCAKRGSDREIPKTIQASTNSICFVPQKNWLSSSREVTAIYGAILYEEKDYNSKSETGKGNAFYEHIIRGDAIANLYPRCFPTSFRPTSIISFQYPYSGNRNGPDLDIIYFEGINYNIGLKQEKNGDKDGKKERTISIKGNEPYKIEAFEFSPYSIKIPGGVLAILQTSDEKITHLTGDDNNLRDNIPITEPGECESAPAGEVCRKPIAKKIIIIPVAKIY